VTDRRVVTYGFNPQADVRAENIELETGGSRFDVVFRSRTGVEDRWNGLFLPMAGRHNTQNVLSAIAVARELNIDEEKVRAALAGFGGVKRRFTQVGEWNGITIIDDYGHHPVEISAVLQAARQVSRGKVHAVVQPHRYSRLKDLFEEFSACFNDADAVYIADVYAAGESPIEGVSGPDLVGSLTRFGHRQARSITKDTLAKTLKPTLEPGDLIVCLGAGDITYWAAGLADELKALK
jgi:UDP-N-acetylmuramate--alanine ligase